MWNVIGEIGQNTLITMGHRLILSEALEYHHILQTKANAAAMRQRIRPGFGLITYWIEPAGEPLPITHQPVPTLNNEAALIH